MTLFEKAFENIITFLIVLTDFDSIRWFGWYSIVSHVAYEYAPIIISTLLIEDYFICFGHIKDHSYK